MEMEFADRLIELRKAKGLSQEQLAEQVGVSRQAISKWETGQASPDTNNLICLAKLYGITLDELLTGKKPETKEDTVYDSKTSVQLNAQGLNVDDGDDHVHVGFDGIRVETGDKQVYVNKDNIKAVAKSRKKEFLLYGVVNSVLLLLAIVAYILLGVYIPSTWAYGWLLFFIPGIVSSIMQCVKHKKVSDFAMSLVVVAAYLLPGFLLDIWHPTWVVFLAIPIFYTIANYIDKANKKADKCVEDEIPEEFTNKPIDVEVEEKEENK